MGLHARGRRVYAFESRRRPGRFAAACEVFGAATIRRLGAPSYAGRLASRRAFDPRVRTRGTAPLVTFLCTFVGAHLSTSLNAGIIA